MFKTQGRAVFRHLALFAPAVLIALSAVLGLVWVVWFTLEMMMWAQGTPSLFDLPNYPPTAFAYAIVTLFAAGLAGSVPIGFITLWDLTKPNSRPGMSTA